MDTTAEQEAEVDRLVGLGARELDWDVYPPDPDFVVLGDPDGNALCVVDLSRAPSGARHSNQDPPGGAAPDAAVQGNLSP